MTEDLVRSQFPDTSPNATKQGLRDAIAVRDKELHQLRQRCGELFKLESKIANNIGWGPLLDELFDELADISGQDAQSMAKEK